MANTLVKPLVHYHKTSRFCDFQGGGRPLSWILELKLPTAMHLNERSESHDTIQVDPAVVDISKFFTFFLVKCKNSPDDRV